MAMIHDKNKAFHHRALKVMPLGTNSNFRYAGEKTFYADHAKGSHIWDVDGNEYIDYKGAFGPIILGHAYDEVDKKVIEAISLGVTYASCTEGEIELAEKVCSMVPCIEKLRLCSSGSEATMHSLRVARAFTGREKFIKFEGQYHGVHDNVLFSMYADPASTYGLRHAPIPVLESAGVPRAMKDLVITLPYNDPEALEFVLKRCWFEVAAIMIEPILGNCAGVEPEPGFLEIVRKLCDQYGIVLIFDEVKTGFRVSRGGAQELYGVTPDMSTFGKAIANGYVLAAFGGKTQVMDVLCPGGVEHAGTHNGHRIAVTAANATLDILRSQPVLETIRKRGLRLKEGAQKIFDQYGAPITTLGQGAMWGWAAMKEKPIGQREYQVSDRAYLHRLASELVERGISVARETREPWFMNYSHTDTDIDHTLNILEDVVKQTQKGIWTE